METQLNSINFFCEELIDYAGLFPPANLTLKDSFQNYVKYKNSEYGFMLSKFICPLNMLDELNEIILSNDYGKTEISLSLLTDNTQNEIEFADKLDLGLDKWKNFSENHNKRVNINSVEIKVPDEIISESDEKKIESFIEKISGKLKNKIQTELYFYFESPSGKDWNKNYQSLLNALYNHNLKNNDSGFKLRTGGIKPELFPTPEQISYTIKECIEKELRLKCTAGLHHPFRHYDYELRTFMHGFINVFAAGLIAYRHNLSEHGMRDIMNDENGNDFTFSLNCLFWKDWQICLDDIETARKELMISFGSCSFDEPVEDLKKLKLLV